MENDKFTDLASSTHENRSVKLRITDGDRAESKQGKIFKLKKEETPSKDDKNQLWWLQN